MFSFLKKKFFSPPPPPVASVPADVPATPSATSSAAPPSPPDNPGLTAFVPPVVAPATAATDPLAEPTASLLPARVWVPAAPAQLAPAEPVVAASSPVYKSSGGLIGSALVTPIAIAPALPLPGSAEAAAAASNAKTADRTPWLNRLQSGLRKTSSNISSVFTGAQIDEALYEDLETALLLADAGVQATAHLLADVRQRVAAGGMTHPVAVKNALVESITQLLKPLQASLVIGEFTPTVILVAGVNGAGKTTTIGKLTRHLAAEGASVLLAAADTFRAAAKEQLAVWADRNTVEIISQAGGDPAAVSFDAVSAGKARGKDVVLVDTAGRLPTQLHLMEELKKIKRVVQKADATAPHEVLLVIDGNTGQNALSQVQSFDAALQLTGLIVTKLDGTAKGGVLAAIALWSKNRTVANPQLRPVPVYFIGVGEKLEDLETFNAREFAQALLS